MQPQLLPQKQPPLQLPPQLQLQRQLQPQPQLQPPQLLPPVTQLLLLPPHPQQQNRTMRRMIHMQEQSLFPLLKHILNTSL